MPGMSAGGGNTSGMFSGGGAVGRAGTMGSSEQGYGEMAGNAWSAAKGWMGSVAEKAEEVENAVWKRINEGGK